MGIIVTNDGCICDRSVTKVLIDLSVGSWRFSRLFVHLLSKLDVENTRYFNQYRYYIKRKGENLKVVGLLFDNRKNDSLLNSYGPLFWPCVAILVTHLG